MRLVPGVAARCQRQSTRPRELAAARAALSGLGHQDAVAKTLAGAPSEASPAASKRDMILVFPMVIEPTQRQSAPCLSLRRAAGQGISRRLSRLAGALAVVGALGGCLTGCQRKAPGPDECLAFAKIWLQQRKFDSLLAQAPDEAFDELVSRCLTEPYDRALVECVISKRRPENCRVDYARRAESRREQVR